MHAIYEFGSDEQQSDRRVRRRRERWPEPGCREAFPWDEPWPADLCLYLAELAALRRENPALRQGSFHWRSVGKDGLMGRSGQLQIWINRSRTEALALPDPQASAEMHWSTEEATAAGAIGVQSASLLLTAPR